MNLSTRLTSLVNTSALCLVALLSLSVMSSAWAQPAQSAPAPTESAQAKAQPSPAAKQATPSEPSAKELTARAAKEDFERVKEERLNQLRYRHLWIAYSLVWLIIFVFIRGTWKRSQAVEDNLRALQDRLTKLEDKA